jgi:hypothetical protein
MNVFTPGKISGTETQEDRRCLRCDGQPSLVRQMLDSRSGKTIRMFKCRCGEQTWVADPP